MQKEELREKVKDYLNGCVGVTCEKVSDESVKLLVDLFDGKIPELLLDMYKEYVLAEEIECGEVVLYGIDRIVDENKDYIPGANIYPLGLFTFASEMDGDSICFDSNDPAFPVYQCSHSLLDDEEEICFSKDGKIQSISFSYENVIRISTRLSDSFDDFIEKLLDDDIELLSVTEMIKKF